MSDDRSATITVIRETERPVVPFTGGATYRPIVGDDTGEGLPIRTGIQTSPPGYATRVHSHPYVETLMVLAGRGEAWLDGEAERVVMEPGVTVVLPANKPHAFRVVGDQPLVTFGIHTFGKRVVNYKDAPASSSSGWTSIAPRINPVISGP
jgi:quercetin dioxygenase-like cupin family protein